MQKVTSFTIRWVIFLCSLLSLRHAHGATPALSAPNISGNALFLYRDSNFHKEDADPANPDPERNGFNLQEAELQFYADVDPYSRLNLLLSVHPEYESSGGRLEEKWAIEPEEAFVESFSVIPSASLKLGKFKGYMGKHNLLHSHAFPFVEAPLANRLLLGDEGLNDAGVSVAVLLPASWFSEVTLQYLRGEGENEEFRSPTPGDGVGLAHWKNLTDWSDSLTMEVGVSYAQGGNSLRQTTSLTGADLTFRWRPLVGGLYQSWTWATEYLGRTRGVQQGSDERAGGIASWLQYQFALRWAALYRYDTLEMRDSIDPTALADDRWERHSVAVLYLPSEFSSFKVEYNDRHGGPQNADGQTNEKTLFVQANFTIGSHPAHSY